jgi:fluoride exporter
VKAYLLIALGSGLGGVARHAATLAVSSRVAGDFPWGTFLVNITGSILIGVVTGLPALRLEGENGLLLRQFLTVGILGGFTTFSAFSGQTLAMIQGGRWALAAAYAAASVFLCVAGAGFGHWLGTKL